MGGFHHPFRSKASRRFPDRLTCIAAAWRQGVYSTDLRIPLAAFGAGLADLTIASTLCPGGKERMRRLMAAIGDRAGQSQANNASVQACADRGGL
jgi:hypothetical protein